MKFLQIASAAWKPALRAAHSLWTLGLLVAFMVGGNFTASAQDGAKQSDSPPPPSTSQASTKTLDFSLPPVDLKALPRNLFGDQKKFWTTPLHMSARQWQWTVPLAFVGAGLLASDTAIERHVPTDPATVSHAVTGSNVGTAALAGVGAGMFLWGHISHNDDQRETGLLSGEAGIDAFLDTEVFKYAFGRERPFTGDNQGHFWDGGTSFPSQHAAVSWAIASVIAHEYPGPLTQALAYGLAGGVSAMRLAGHQHFATDVLVGSALGWYMGRHVFQDHSHYGDTGMEKWGKFEKEVVHGTANMGSPFVPLDSWIYPAMERLTALGYIHSGYLGMRPWTRMECARLVHDEAQSSIESAADAAEASTIYAELSTEFRNEIARLGGAPNVGISVDSVYTRMMGIAGTPLTDGLHFGQTIINDYGRPYGEGFSNVTGFSSHAVLGPLSFYLRAEYQHAPSIAGLSAQAAGVVQSVDGLPSAPPTTPLPSVNRLDVLEGYVGMQFSNWQVTFGKQSLWWGADEGGATLFSDNAEPILMLRINRVTPFQLPSVFGVLGPIRVEYLVGRLSGYHWVLGPNGFAGSWTETLSDQPFIVGEKVSLKPTENLEFGISETSLFGGPGVTANPHSLLRAMFSVGNGNPGTPQDPGDRRGGFDFAYRVPGARDWMTFYADAFTDDEPNPWVGWDKTSLTSGLYLARIPGIRKLDFRVEGVYTDPPGGGLRTDHGFFYFNDRFRSGYTNDGNLIGSWIGRQGQGAQAWTTYWLSPKSKIAVNFRHQEVSPSFIPQGGALTDFGVSGDYWLRSNLGLSAWVQHERWRFPVIQANVSNNVTAALQITFEPRRLFARSHSSNNQPTSVP